MVFTRRLHRSAGDRIISGVAGGMAEYFVGIDPVFVRLAWIGSVFVTGGVSILVYIAMIFIVPKGSEEPQTDAHNVTVESGHAYGRSVEPATNVRERRHYILGGCLVAAGIWLLAYNLDIFNSVNWSVVGAVLVIAAGASLIYASARQRRLFAVADLGELRQPKTRISILAIVLLILGTVLLLNTTGLVGWGIWIYFLEFWPVILIAIGLHLIMGRRFPVLSAILVAVILGAGVSAAHLSAQDSYVEDIEVYSYLMSADGVDRLDLDIAFGAGSLVIDSLGAKDRDVLIAAEFDRIGADLEESLDGAVAEVVMSVNSTGIERGSNESG